MYLVQEGINLLTVNLPDVSLIHLELNKLHRALETRVRDGRVNIIRARVTQSYFSFSDFVCSDLAVLQFWVFDSNLV